MESSGWNEALGSVPQCPRPCPPPRAVLPSAAGSQGRPAMDPTVPPSAQPSGSWSGLTMDPGPAQRCWFSEQACRGPHGPTKCPVLWAPDLPARPSWSLFSLPFLGHNITHQRRGPGAFRSTRKTPRATVTCIALSGDGGCCGVCFHGLVTRQTDAGPACSRGPADVITEDCRSSGNVTLAETILALDTKTLRSKRGMRVESRPQ